MRFPILTAAWLLLGCAGSWAADEPPDSLFGLWATRLDLGAEIRGELRLTRTHDRWRAAIADANVEFPARGDSVRFELPGGRGGFRGALRDQGQTVGGFWLQPPGRAPDPAGTRQPFATPMVLRGAGRDQWRGTVQPLDGRFTLYLKIYRLPNGTRVGAFRNPEANAIGGATLFRVMQEGDSVWFVVRADSSAPYEKYVRGSITRSPRRIRLYWRNVNRVLELTPRTPKEAPDFFPHRGGDTSYVYGPPAQTEDGWETARARDVGMDEATLAEVVKRLLRLDPAARRAPLVHSLLVAHRGKLVLEEYFFGFDRDQPHDTRSAGKTFASVMLGAAMREGVPIGPESRIYEVVAARGPFANPDPRKARITLAHLLTHTSGLACDDNSESSPGNEGTMQSQEGQPDWWKYTLDLPMAHEPGERYAYCSANTNLAGAALTTATRTWLPELFDRTIARPLQFGRYHWNLMPTGEGYQGGGAYLRPRDLLKVGQAFLDGGVWRGRRIVDSSWVRVSTIGRVEISPSTTGLDSLQFPEFYGRGVDALAWHLNTLRTGDRGFRQFEATGNGGQLLMVLPELDLTVVITAGNYGHGGIWSRFRDEIVAQGIMTAIRGK